MVGYLNTNSKHPANASTKPIVKTTVAAAEKNTGNITASANPVTAITDKDFNKASGKVAVAASKSTQNNISKQIWADTDNKTNTDQRIVSGISSVVNNVIDVSAFINSPVSAFIKPSVSTTSLVVDETKAENSLITEPGDFTLSPKESLTGGNNSDEIQILSSSEKINQQLIQPEALKSDALVVAAAASKVSGNTAQNINSGLTAEQRSWIENYALYNRPVPKKWKGRLAWQGYFTPSVVYRNLYSNVNLKNTPANYSFATRQLYDDAASYVTHKPSFGFEAGAGLQYSLFKWLKVRTGLQLNYTRYGVRAYENDHPSSTTLAMVDEETKFPYEVFRASKYSNLYGLIPVKLHNQTYQLSIPVGVDVKIAGYENIELYTAASIQPTLVLGGKSYLISADRQSYISETSMLNRLNVNTAFEIYVSYKSGNGYTWQLGPQYRTQLGSTNSKYYATGEKILNYGFKIGISKKL